MKNLLVFAVAVISATYPNLAKSQKSVVSVSVGNTEKVVKPLKFIEGIQIKREFTSATLAPVQQETVKITAVAIPKVEQAKGSASNIEACTSIQFKYAQLMNVEVEDIASLKTLEFVEDWWGTRYRYGGTTRSGIDCSSFTGKLYESVFGITCPRTAREQYRVTERIKRADLQEGDFVFFNTRGGVSHVGVYIAKGYFAHSSTSSGVTVSSLDDKYYSARFIGGGRYVNTE